MNVWCIVIIYIFLLSDISLGRSLTKELLDLESSDEATLISHPAALVPQHLLARLFTKPTSERDATYHVDP